LKAFWRYVLCREVDQHQIRYLSTST